ncbi:MAG TPA: hypothetical protein VMH02_01000 [Verrucomicrobiae bacterium]|nr:hypothetical protein [Verrucomicrobiae bacterium]
MRLHKHIAIAAALAALVATASFAGSTAAQNYPAYGMPNYTTWQPGWDTYRYDKHHVVLGIVAGFSPYRITIQRRGGDFQTIDLKNGTLIFPRGATPTQGEHAALVGYYSDGTFIANRVVLRP